MPSIKAVLFDLGGTLFDYVALTNAEREAVLKLVQSAEINAEFQTVHNAYRKVRGYVIKKYFPLKFYYHRDLFKETVDKTLEKFDVKPDSKYYDQYWQTLLARHRQDFQLREGVMETLSSLREKNLHLGLVSNIDEDHLAHLLELSKIEPYFDSILSSEKTQSCKPDPDIFYKALEHAGCRSDEVLFVGDTPMQDIAGANQVGMNSVLIYTEGISNMGHNTHKPDHVIREIPEILNLL